MGAGPEAEKDASAPAVPEPKLGKTVLESLDEPALPTTEATEEEGEYTLQEWVEEEDELIRVRRQNGSPSKGLMGDAFLE